MNINPDTAKDTLCKNILIYGYCKYENKGCAFSHTRKEPVASGAANASKTAVHNAAKSAEKRKFNMNTPSFQPAVQALTSKFSTLSPRVKEIPIFVPSSSEKSESDKPEKDKLYDSGNDSTASLEFKATYQNTPQFPALTQPYQNTNSQYAPTQSYPSTPSYPTISSQYSYQPPFSSDMYSNYPLQYHLYAPAPPPRMMVPVPPHCTNVHDMFIPNSLRETLHKRNEATLQTIPRSNLPDHVNEYHSLVPIDKTYEPESSIWGHPSSVYKVFSNTDGNAYCMRRIDLSHDMAKDSPFRNIKRWMKVASPGVASVRDCFTSVAFGGVALVVVYDYYPNAATLLETHKKGALSVEPVTEALIWSYLVQLVAALRIIHAEGLVAGKVLDLSKIIVTSKNRVRLSGVGIEEILNTEDVEASSDSLLLGKVLIDLCALMLPPNNREPAAVIENLQQSAKISAELAAALGSLMDGADLDIFSKEHLMNHMFKAFADSCDAHDYLESQMSNEIENARVFRLLAKLNFVIDRPDADMAENGSKYALRLFRDYVFFSRDEAGRPCVDLARVLTCLNKLDVGVDESVCLVSRDEKTCMVVSYRELRDMVGEVFRELH